MNNYSTIKNSPHHIFARPVTVTIFIIYILLLIYAISHHEPWGDEIHSWNIAKASRSFGDLVWNTRYEGHPPLWYSILWVISKFTHDFAYVQVVHGVFAGLIVFIVLFFSPFPFITKMLIPFGYYFLYEYAALSRNYAIAVLLVFCICLVIHKSFKYKFLLYYILLFLMSNAHLIALLLAASVHLYFLLLQIENKKKRIELALHILLGGFIFLSSLYFIAPPSDSEFNLNAKFWVSRWNPQQIRAIIQLPLRTLIPVPAWWNVHFWNTEFLLEAKNKFGLLKFINPLISLMLCGVVFFILRKSKKSLVLFFTNLALNFIVTIAVFSLTTARYSGFIFIGFVVAYWLYCYENPTDRRNTWLVNIMLVLQIIAGFFVVSKDFRLPFSNANKINELLKEIPQGEKGVTDYWALNTISAFADESFYCIDMQKEKYFIQWDKDLGYSENNPNRYYDGIINLFKRERISKLYMITTIPPQNLLKVDSKLSSFHIVLVDKKEGAIEKGSNLYLYQMSSY